MKVSNDSTGPVKIDELAADSCARPCAQLTAPDRRRYTNANDGFRQQRLCRRIVGYGTAMSSVDGPRVARAKIDAVALVGCSLLSGLLTQSDETAGPDGVREQGPILLNKL